MKHDLIHVMFLQKAASSENLFKKNPILFCVAVNDYRYYKAKFIAKHKKADLIIEDNEWAKSKWREIKHPYAGKIKYGFKVRKQKDYYNIPWLNKTN